MSRRSPGEHQRPDHQLRLLGCVRAGIYTLAAYFAGNMLKQASGIIDWVLIGVAVVAVAAIVVLIRRETDRLAVRAEAAYPGPLSAGRPNGRSPVRR